MKKILLLLFFFFTISAGFGQSIRKDASVGAAQLPGHYQSGREGFRFKANGRFKYHLNFIRRVSYRGSWAMQGDSVVVHVAPRRGGQDPLGLCNEDLIFRLQDGALCFERMDANQQKRCEVLTRLH